MHKSHTVKYDVEKKAVSDRELASLGRTVAPVTIVHNVPLQAQHGEANANTDANANAATYDSFESDDDGDEGDQNVEPNSTPRQGVYPAINTYDQNQNTKGGGYPEGTYTYYQAQEDESTGLQQEYSTEGLEGGDVKYDLVTESSSYVPESDYIKEDS